jgi:hypothetical protein
MVIPALGLGGLALAQPPATTADQSRRDAAGWLELEADQRRYRDRVEPLDRRDERQLETIERRQALDLRVLQQRQRQALEQEQRTLRRRRQEAGADWRPPRPANSGFDAQREQQRLRLDRQLEQYRLPFRRSPGGP